MASYSNWQRVQAQTLEDVGSNPTDVTPVTYPKWQRDTVERRDGVGSSPTVTIEVVPQSAEGARSNRAWCGFDSRRPHSCYGAAMRIAARAPNHLGDGVMALPALHALAGLGSLVIHAPRWGPDLYRDVPATVRPVGPMQGDLAVLFAPSVRAAWEARACARRVGVPAESDLDDGRRRAPLRRLFLTDAVPPRVHRADTFRALAEAVGAVVVGDPRYDTCEDDPLPTCDDGAPLPADHVGLAPLSVMGATREWGDYRALADQLADEDRPVVFYAGPGEEERVRAIAGPHVCCSGAPLPALARALGRCRTFVGNDSGLSHFARACGVRTIVLFGSTAPRHTGAAGALVIERDVDCRPCQAATCKNPAGRVCLDVPAARVRMAIG